jgi:hypothetical protein
LEEGGEGAPEPSPTQANLIVFLVSFKAMTAAKTFMSQGNWSKREVRWGGFSATPWRDQSSGLSSLTHCEDFA